MTLMLDITEKETGLKVGVPVSEGSADLAKKFPYWRAYYFQRGCGIPMDCISDKSLKAAAPGDYEMTVMDKGKIIWDSKNAEPQAG